MGRNRKPTHLTIVDGTKDRHDRTGEPVPTSPLGKAPAHMTAREAQVWKRVAGDLPPEMLKAVDEYILTAFCRAVAISDQATELLRAPQEEYVPFDPDDPEFVNREPPKTAPPLLALTPNGLLQQHAYLSIINRQAVLIKSLGSELGLSPAARTRISLGGDDEDKNDPTAKYFA